MVKRGSVVTVSEAFAFGSLVVVSEGGSFPNQNNRTPGTFLNLSDVGAGVKTPQQAGQDSSGGHQMAFVYIRDIRSGFEHYEKKRRSKTGSIREQAALPLL